jgi:deoxyadenosine/deoxycytidine kinase
MPTNIVVEGNIGSGKSTFLEEVSTMFHNDNIHIIQEPVNDWCVVKDNHNMSLFENFYENPNKYAFLLQMNILSSRHKTMNDIVARNCKTYDVNIFERSVLTDKNIFVPALHDMSHFTKMELEVFTNMFDCMASSSTSNIDAIIYLKCSPEVSYDRVIKRNRHGEKGITLQYLDLLHTKHEEWLSNYTEAPVYTLDVSSDLLSYGTPVVKELVRQIIDPNCKKLKSKLS